MQKYVKQVKKSGNRKRGAKALKRTAKVSKVAGSDDELIQTRIDDQYGSDHDERHLTSGPFYFKMFFMQFSSHHKYKICKSDRNNNNNNNSVWKHEIIIVYSSKVKLNLKMWGKTLKKNVLLF